MTGRRSVALAPAFATARARRGGLRDDERTDARRQRCTERRADRGPTGTVAPTAEPDEQCRADPPTRPGRSTRPSSPSGSSPSRPDSTARSTSSTPGDGSGRLFVVEQAGRIRIVKDGAVVDPPFLDIRRADRSPAASAVCSGSRSTPTTRRTRASSSTTPTCNGDTVVSSFTRPGRDAGPGRPGQRAILLHIDQPFANHNGGEVAFGPDGMLYIGMGDGGSGGDPQGNGQRLDTLLGKILRIDVDGPADSRPPYTIPPDNPFAADRERQARDLVVGPAQPVAVRVRPRRPATCGSATSARAPGRRSTSSGAGRRAAPNFGWNIMEGAHCYEPSTVRPDRA